MKTRTRRSRSAAIPKTRWLAYATAGAATAFAGSQSVEASIHYSGRLDVPFPPHEDTTYTFRLDQAGDSLVFEHKAFGKAYLYVNGIAHAGLSGRTDSSVFRVYKLGISANIGGGTTFYARRYGRLAEFSFDGYWLDHGTGYVGFSFNNGAGKQLGWVRVKMTGEPQNGFRVLGYAYADPGESIRTGQRSSDEQAPEKGSTNEQAPEEGSLGWLAVGAAGLLAWRKSRSRTTTSHKATSPSSRKGNLANDRVRSHNLR